MPKRPNRMLVSLSDAEKNLCEILALRSGLEPPALMRQAMMEKAERAGLTLPSKPQT